MSDRQDETPYDELDPPVLSLCRAVNAFPGVWTAGSCGGHADEGHELPADRWRVTFRCELGDDYRPTLEAWLSAEFIAWVVYDMQKADLAVWLDASARPPYLNWPAAMLSFELMGERGGENGAEPDTVAGALDRLRDRWTLPEAIRKRVLKILGE